MPVTQSVQGLKAEVKVDIPIAKKITKETDSQECHLRKLTPFSGQILSWEPLFFMIGRLPCQHDSRL